MFTGCPSLCVCVRMCLLGFATFSDQLAFDFQFQTLCFFAQNWKYNVVSQISNIVQLMVVASRPCFGVAVSNLHQDFCSWTPLWAWT